MNADSDEQNDETDEMESTDCIYSMKQTHYHCLVCDCAVLSRAQLGAHQHKD